MADDHDPKTEGKTPRKRKGDDAGKASRSDKPKPGNGKPGDAGFRGRFRVRRR